MLRTANTRGKHAGLPADRSRSAGVRHDGHHCVIMKPHRRISARLDRGPISTWNDVRYLYRMTGNSGRHEDLFGGSHQCGQLCPSFLRPAGIQGLRGRQLRSARRLPGPRTPISPRPGRRRSPTGPPAGHHGVAGPAADRCGKGRGSRQVLPRRRMDTHPVEHSISSTAPRCPWGSASPVARPAAEPCVHRAGRQRIVMRDSQGTADGE